MNNEYQSGLYGTNVKYFQTLGDFNAYIQDDTKDKEIPNVALIEEYNEELEPDDIVLTPISNPAVWGILDTAGLIDEGKTSLTVQDCAEFTNEDLYNKTWDYEHNDNGVCKQTSPLTQSNGCSIFTYYNTFNEADATGGHFDDMVDRDSDPWTFNEFKYFTGITEIGYSFFRHCRGLREISIPSSVTSIGEMAFGDCIKLSICRVYNTRSNVTIYITEDQSSIEDADGAGVEHIFAAGSAFSYAGKLYVRDTDIWFINAANNYVVAYNWVPEDRSSLEPVITANSNPDVYNILTTCNYPHTGANNGYTASDLAAITSITVSSQEIESLSDNNMSIFSFYGNEKNNYDSTTCGNGQSVPYNGPNDANFVESWTFNEFRYFTGLTSIPDNCFNNCTTLTEITLPYTITHVGNRAFHDCWAIEKFDTQGRISSIEWNPNSIYYMSKDIVGEGYWDNLEDGVEEQLYYLNNHGVVVS